MSTRIKDVINSNKCTECYSCFSSCPKNAISINNLQPIVDESVCISCQICEKKCHILNQFNNDYQQEYYYGKWDNELAKKSSSGGIASAVAYDFISKGGVVYGASICFKNNRLVCEHIRIDRVDDLYKIQGSKYVQSKISGALPLVKKDLEDNNKVLFIGCSCQVAAVRLFVPQKQLPNLATIDLVCHGVPKDNMFYDYISYLEKKYNASVIDISFRERNNSKNKSEKNYVLNIIFRNKKTFVKRIGLRKSSFYRLYMAMAGYKDSCYQCKYTSLHKPGDITLGDAYCYSPELFSKKDCVSTILVNTKQGKEMLDAINDLTFKKADKDEVVKHHYQLSKPSYVTDVGKKLFEIYLAGGFKSLERYIKIRNILTFPFRIFKK